LHNVGHGRVIDHYDANPKISADARQVDPDRMYRPGIHGGLRLVREGWSDAAHKQTLSVELSAAPPRDEGPIALADAERPARGY
jgi:hypothetical protein